LRPGAGRPFLSSLRDFPLFRRPGPAAEAAGQILPSLRKGGNNTLGYCPLFCVAVYLARRASQTCGGGARRRAAQPRLRVSDTGQIPCHGELVEASLFAPGEERFLDFARLRSE
jgi:hypothetical protein